METIRLEKLAAAAIYAGRPWSLHQDLSATPPATLTESIERFGLLHPPVVRKLRDGSYETVCGARRLRALLPGARENSVLSCRVLPSGMVPAAILQLAAEEQQLSGPLTIIEKARFAALCRQMLPDGEAQRLIERTGIGAPAALARAATLLTLEPVIVEAIHTGLITEKTGYELLSLPSAERLFLVDLISRLYLNANKQRRLLDLLRTLATRQSCTYRELLAENHPALGDGATPDNIPQAVHALLMDLAQRCQPLSSAAEKQFTGRIRALNLPHFCSVTHSPAFERDRVTLSIDFEDLETLIAAWPALRRYLGDPGEAPPTAP